MFEKTLTPINELILDMLLIHDILVSYQYRITINYSIRLEFQKTIKMYKYLVIFFFLFNKPFREIEYKQMQSALYVANLYYTFIYILENR